MRFSEYLIVLMTNETIKKEGDKYVVYSEDMTRTFGTYNTEEEAKKRLQELHFFKGKK